MPLLPLEAPRHMFDGTEYLMDEKWGLTKEHCLGNATLRRAFVRSIETVGEASKKVPTELKDQYPGFNWRAMAGMRDRLIHDHCVADYEIVGDVVENKIPGAPESRLEIPVALVGRLHHIRGSTPDA